MIREHQHVTDLLSVDTFRCWLPTSMVCTGSQRWPEGYDAWLWAYLLEA